MKIFNEPMTKDQLIAFHSILGGTKGYYLKNPVFVDGVYVVSYAPTKDTLSQWYSFLSEEEACRKAKDEIVRRRKVANRCAICAFVAVCAISAFLFIAIAFFINT